MRTTNESWTDIAARLVRRLFGHNQTKTKKPKENECGIVGRRGTKMSNQIGYSIAADPDVDKVRKQWEEKLSALKGLIIKDVRYMRNEEAEKLDFFHSCVVIELEDGTCLWPTFDDEGSDGGALQIQVGDKSKNHGLPFNAPAIQLMWEEEVADGRAVGS